MKPFKACWIPAARVLLFCLCCVAILIGVSALTKGIASPLSDIALAAGTSLLTFILSLIFIKWERSSSNRFGILPRKGTFAKTSAGFLFGLALATIHAGTVMAFTGLRLSWNPEISMGRLLSAFALFCLASLREELAFRGYALQTLGLALGKWKAQLIIAFIFAMEHMAGGYTWKQAFLGSAIGAVFFGMAAFRTNGIAFPVGLHMAWNFGQWCLGFKNESGLWKIAKQGSGGNPEDVTLLIYVFVMGFAMLVLPRLAKRFPSLGYSTS